MANGSKREFFDNAYESPQASTHHAQDLKSYIRMCETEGLKILFAYKQEADFVDRDSGRGIVAAVEDRQLGDGTARPINAEHVLSSARRTFEDADMSGDDYVHSSAGLAFAKTGCAR